MIITEPPGGSQTIIAICGTLDASTAPELRNNPAIADPSRTVVIDFAKMDFLDSSGLGVLVEALRRKHEANATILLSRMNPPVRKVFDITGTCKLFHIFDDTDAAADYAATYPKGT